MDKITYIFHDVRIARMLMIVWHGEVFFHGVLGIREREFGGLFVFDVKFSGVVCVGLFQHVVVPFDKIGFVH